MLVLSRKPNERLIIDENIIVTIVRVAGDTVRIGIEAPAEIAIRREEISPRVSRDPEELATRRRAS
ncbi:MAG: carbon storage regulator [Pirellulaceae bacterium]|jgi:carbon storage regulator|nr:carbon storage regulator [Pirellulaceae bacterium]